MAKKDYYDVLGISKGAGESDVKSAYRKLARQYHPDVNKAADAEAKFKELQEAYGVIGDPKKRQQYDQLGHAAFDQAQGFGGGGGFGGFDFSGGGGGADMEDIFDSIFGGSRRSGGRGGRGGAERGNDLRYDLTMSMEEAATGVNKKFDIVHNDKCTACKGTGAKEGSKPTNCGTCGGAGQVRHTQRTILGSFSQVSTCPNCRGRGTVVSDPCRSCSGQGVERKPKTIEVAIPAGVDSGSKIRVSGAGDAGSQGGPAGDLYVFITVKAHKYFQREGNDLILRVTISYPQAVLGDDIDVPTIDGQVSLKIPPSTPSHTVFRIRGKGMPALQGYGRGDQHVQVVVEVPKSTTGKEKELLQQLDKLQNEKKQNKSIFDRVIQALT